MTYIPCHEQHADSQEAMDCIRAAAAARAANRSPEWDVQLRRLMTPEPAGPYTPPPPKPLPIGFQLRFVQTLATAVEFRGAVSAWMGVAP
ncbi:MAG: hypothetical protein SH850_24110 [Planctomycetaceae bacterium]|nr:hypothetical protein [Planctomycetaceae bacterium]